MQNEKSKLKVQLIPGTYRSRTKNITLPPSVKAVVDGKEKELKAPIIPMEITVSRPYEFDKDDEMTREYFENLGIVKNCKCKPHPLGAQLEISDPVEEAREEKDKRVLQAKITLFVEEMNEKEIVEFMEKYRIPSPYPDETTRKNETIKYLGRFPQIYVNKNKSDREQRMLKANILFEKAVNGRIILRDGNYFVHNDIRQTQEKFIQTIAGDTEYEKQLVNLIVSVESATKEGTETEIK